MLTESDRTVHISNMPFIKNAHYINKCMLAKHIYDNNNGNFDILDKYPFVLEFLYRVLTKWEFITVHIQHTDNDLVICNVTHYHILDAYMILSDDGVSVSLISHDSHNYYYEHKQFVSEFRKSINLDNWVIHHDSNGIIKYKSITGASPNEM